MNHGEHPDDSTLTRELRESLSDLAVAERPPLAAVTSRGRAPAAAVRRFRGSQRY